MKPDSDADGFPKLALFLWLDDGTARQVKLGGPERKAILETIIRMHNFELNVTDKTFNLIWKDGH